MVSLPDGLCIVINLESARQRFDFQCAQLARLGLPFMRLPAVGIDEIEPAQMAALRRGWLRPLLGPEVCCLLSHRKAWEMVVASGRPRVILEDDVILASDIAPLLAELLALRGVGYVNLESFDTRKALSRQSDPLGQTGYRLSRLLRDRGGSGGYLIWPEAARRALDFTKDRMPLADMALDLALGTDRFQLEPAPLQQAMFVKGFEAIAGSSISVARRPRPRAGLDWAGYKLRRLTVSLGLAARLLPRLGRMETRAVRFAGVEGPGGT